MNIKFYEPSDYRSRDLSMNYYIIKYADGRNKSCFLWTDGEAIQFAKDFSLGYPCSIEVYKGSYESPVPDRVLEISDWRTRNCEW